MTERLRELAARRASHGYRRAAAVLSRELISQGQKTVNHKRVYRLMKAESLLLPKFLGHGKIQRHEGQVVTLRSNTRWCSDSFQFRCWDGEKIEAAVEHRFPKTPQAPGKVQWLTDNGGIFTADMTSRIATEFGLIPCRTPAYCPESNGMSFPGKGKLIPDEEKQRSLEAENKRLKLENEFLKKAATYFAAHQK